MAPPPIEAPIGFYNDPDTNDKWTWHVYQHKHNCATASNQNPHAFCCDFQDVCMLARGTTENKCLCVELSDPAHPCPGYYEHIATGHKYCFSCAYQVCEQENSPYN